VSREVQQESKKKTKKNSLLTPKNIITVRGINQQKKKFQPTNQGTLLVVDPEALFSGKKTSVHETPCREREKERKKEREERSLTLSRRRNKALLRIISPIFYRAIFDHKWTTVTHLYF